MLLGACHQLELRTAIEHGKKIVLVHETEGAHGRFDFVSEKAAAPDDLRSVLEDVESVAYRRRDHERNAMLTKVIGLVPGYAELLESAKEQSSTLAAIPPGEQVYCLVPVRSQLSKKKCFQLHPQRSTIGRASTRFKREKRTKQ